MTPFTEILRRKRLARTPGFAGGDIEDQIARDQGAQVSALPDQQAATRPRRTYNTTLSPEEEQAFAVWKQQNAPNDSGADYDLRGAFKAGLKPDVQSGHWPDTFKKPNHPTFSNQSQYAVGADAARAGQWNRDRFVPASLQLASGEPRISDPRDPSTLEVPQGYGKPVWEPWDHPVDGVTGEYVSSPASGSSFRNAFASRMRRTEPRDYIADDEAYLRDLESRPEGKWKRLGQAGVNALQVLGGQKPEYVPTSRDREIAKVENRLGRGLKIRAEQQRFQQGSMVPVTLDNGEQVMVPARQAGTLQSQQQRIKQQGDTLAERKAVNENRKRHWDAMDSRDRKRLIVSLYNSGGLNDPELLEYAADQLQLPGTMREKFIAGRMRDAIDENGNLIEVNKQTGTATPILDAQGKPQGSIQGTLEAGRNRRAAAAQAGADRRISMRGTGNVSADKVSVRKSAQLRGTIDAVRKKLERLDEQIGRNPNDATLKAEREKVQTTGEQAAGELNGLGVGYEAGPGEKGYPYYKQGGQQPPQSNYAGRTMSMANLQRYANDKGISLEEARKQVEDAGVKVKQ